MLELTVAHLRRLATHHPSESGAGDEYYLSTAMGRGGILSGSSSTGDGGRQQFREGYRRCQEEVMRFLGRTAAVQPHVTSRLWQQFHVGQLTTAPRDGHSSPEWVRVATDLNSPASGRPHAAPDGASPPHLLMKKPLESRPDPQEAAVAQGSCVRPSAPPHHTPYAHVHWKKCLKPSSRTCFWRPW